MTTIDNSQDVMDSREIIERLEELRGTVERLEELREERAPLQTAVNELRGKQEPEAFAAAVAALVEWDADNAEELASLETLGLEESEELAALEAFAAQLEGYGDWEHGESVIRDCYFTTYIEELINDCYPDAAKSANSSEWPYRHMAMDFEAAADEAKSDYTEAEFDGVTYLMRA